MNKKKVLIVAYYWPPSGGAGVQRWLKLTKYLCQLDVEVHVLTVDEKYASYMQLDHSLVSIVNSNLKIYKTKSFEPINFYSKIVGKKNVPTAGFSNVNNTKPIQKIINSIRSNFFIPDPRRGWKKYAVKKALEILKKEQIDTIITTSPPHSSQLIGLSLKKKMDVKWIVDFRDPWTDIYYYKILGHSCISRFLDKRLEKKVLTQSDKIITVSKGFKEIFAKKLPSSDSTKFHIIPNGFDEEDFHTSKKTRDKTKFVICYTGTISDQYEPNIFIDAVKAIIEKNRSIKIKLQFIGAVSSNILDYIQQGNIPFEFIKTVPHKKIVDYQVQADLLLLLIPRVLNAEGIVPGKVFEYLASGNNILGIGPCGSDVGEILKSCNQGAIFDWQDEANIFSFLQKEVDNFLQGTQTSGINRNEVLKYTRKFEAKMVRDLL